VSWSSLALSPSPIARAPRTSSPSTANT
jgi:hypothetical protein